MYLNVYADCKKKSWNLFFQNLKAENYFIELTIRLVESIKRDT